MNGKIRVEAEHREATRSLVTQGGPLVFSRERLPHAKRSRKLPVGGLRPPRRMVPHDLLEPAAHHFGETEFVLAGETFCLVIQMIRNLNLCFYHDGILPSSDAPGNARADPRRRFGAAHAPVAGRSLRLSRPSLTPCQLRFRHPACARCQGRLSGEWAAPHGCNGPNSYATKFTFLQWYSVSGVVAFLA